MWALYRNQQQRYVEKYRNRENAEPPSHRRQHEQNPLADTLTIQRAPTETETPLHRAYSSMWLLGGHPMMEYEFQAVAGEDQEERSRSQDEVSGRLSVLDRYVEKAKISGRVSEPPSTAGSRSSLASPANSARSHAAWSVHQLYEETLNLLFRDRIDVGKLEPTMPDFKSPRSIPQDAVMEADWQQKGAQLDQQQQQFRQKEKELLVQLWKQEWERHRPPRDGWNQLTGNAFHLEMQKNRNMIVNLGKFRREERAVKDKLLEIRWHVLIQNLKHGRVMNDAAISTSPSTAPKPTKS